jgi:predicted phosphodiesterase
MPYGQQKSVRLDCCRAYRDKYGMDMPTSKLAKIIYEENNLLFKDKEDARVCLRYIEGKRGGRARMSYMQNSKYYMEKNRSSNPYSLPESDETNYDPFILNAKRVLLLSDIHIPYHSIEALTAALEFAEKENPDCILLNGDTLDFHGLSRFVRDPKKRSVSHELGAFKQFMDILKTVFPSAKIIFKVGNHEERYQHFLWSKAAELTDVAEFDFENIIKARAEGIQYVSDKRIINLNGLNIIHGHEFSSGFFSPVNVARGLFLRAKTSAIQGHNHQTSEHTESDMNGKITTTWSVGCLCELHPAYSPINKWNWGFAIIDSAEDGFEVRNKRIFKGKVL